MAQDNFKVRDRRGDNRFFVDNAFLKQWGAKLGPHCIAVYSALAMYSDADDQTSYPSFQTIADLTGMSRRQVVREIEKLKTNNIIKVEERKEAAGESGNKVFLSNIFTLLHPDVWGKDNLSIREPSDSVSLPIVTDSHQPSDTLSLPLVTLSHPNNTKENKTQLITPNGVGETPPPEKGVKPKTIIKDGFLELTRLQMPNLKRDSKYWWAQFGEILTLARGDPLLACEWQSETIGYMQANHLTITGPQSILGMIRALASGQSLQQPKGQTNGRYAKPTKQPVDHRLAFERDGPPTPEQFKDMLKSVSR